MPTSPTVVYPGWVTQLEADSFFNGATPSEHVFLPAFVERLNILSAPKTTGADLPAAAPANMAALVGQANGLAATHPVRLAVAAASNLTPAAVFVPAMTGAGDDVVMGAIKDIYLVNAAIPYVTADIGKVAYATLVTSAMVDKKYGDSNVAALKKRAVTDAADMAEMDRSLQGRAEKLETVRHNLLAMSDNDAVMRRQRLVAKGVYIASLVVAVCFVLGAGGAFLTGRHGALYVASAVVMSLVFLLNAAGVLRQMVLWWG